MLTTSALKVARTPTGYCIRVEGRGTMKESATAAVFAARSLEDGFVLSNSELRTLKTPRLDGLVRMSGMVRRQTHQRHLSYQTHT